MDFKDRITIPQSEEICGMLHNSLHWLKKNYEEKKKQTKRKKKEKKTPCQTGTPHIRFQAV